MIFWKLVTLINPSLLQTRKQLIAQNQRLKSYEETLDQYDRICDVSETLIFFISSEIRFPGKKDDLR